MVADITKQVLAEQVSLVSVETTQRFGKLKFTFVIKFLIYLLITS